jgi:hypothetical protein
MQRNIPEHNGIPLGFTLLSIKIAAKIDTYKPTAVLVQFNVRLLISVVGSKIENKFLITFS